MKQTKNSESTHDAAVLDNGMQRDSESDGTQSGNLREIADNDTGLPPDAFVVPVAPEPPERFSRDRQGKPLRRSFTAGRDFTGGAMHMASQPFQYATNMGRNVGGFVLGELGYPMPSCRPANDPSQISCTPGIATGAIPTQGTSLSRIPEMSQQPEEDVAQQGEASHLDDRSENSNSSENSNGSTVQSPEPNHREGPELPSDKDAGLQGQLSTASQADSDMAVSSSDDSKKLGSDSPASSVFGDITVHGHGHYNPDNDVILRMEAMTAGEVRALNFVLWTWLTAAAAVLIWQFTEKLMDGEGAVRNENYFIVNVSIGSFLFVCVNAALLGHLLSIRANLHKTWTPRRLRTTILITIELVAQWVMVLSFILPNILILKGGCWLADNQMTSWFVFARWTCWNTLFLIAIISAHNCNISSAYQRSTDKLAGHGRTDLTVGSDTQPIIVADLPFWVAHWWKVILWICMECSVIATTVYVIIASRQNEEKTPRLPRENCLGETANIVCNIGQGSLIVSSIMVAFSLLYFLLYCNFLRLSLKQLRQHSNVEFKLANTNVRIQMRLRLPAFAFFALCVLLLWYVRPYSCNSVITTWLGMLPGQMISTVLAICLVWVASPKRCLGKGRPPLLQVWLQEFAWTKAEKAEKLAKRNASMASQDKAQIEKEPMFCVEAMLVCLYWSLLIYDFEESQEARVSIEEACSLFRPPMVAYEMFWEKSLDTKCLMAWSRKEIILVFRGTASLTNVVADVQAWRTVHLPKRGSPWRQPKIHSGFDRLWRNNGLNERVIAKLKDLFVTGQVDRDDYRFYVTGHSLGGALATLAAYEIRHIGKQHGKDKCLTCITFGAPRTGNHCFAAEYNEMVPDSWNVINDQDLIARGGKFLALYKRGGHRVIINPLGDLIVRPSPLEASLRILPLSGSVQQHLLSSYLESIVSVLLAQFSKQQRLSGSMTRIVEIVRHNKPLEKLILDEAGLELKDMLHMSRWGGYAPLVAQYQAKSLASRHKSGSPRLGRDSSNRPTRWLESRGCCEAISLWMDENLRSKCLRPGQKGKVPNTKDGRLTEQEQ